ncbi:MAG: hypothetical protein FWC38_04485 [Proteobacteria bacterium]|nr:hypothetical protein [Pseudomonadota bacterium]MCL2307480.1 hypothetical protein [Pseudomonadota bacterium]
MKKVFEKRDGRKERSGQRGGMLLEVLVSVLLFALGIVALVGLQGRSLGVTDDVQHRAEAMHLTNAYMGKILAAANGGLAGGGRLTGDQIRLRFAGANSVGGADYQVFANQVLAIPGVQMLAPTVSFDFVDNTGTVTDLLDRVRRVDSFDVTITVQWQDRGDQGTVPRQYRQTFSAGY